MLKQVSFIFLLLSMMTVQVVAAPYVKIEQNKETVEVSALKITLNNESSGKIILQDCSDCKKIIVTITSDTKAFKSNKEVPLVQAKDQIGKSVLVSYIIKSKAVTRIDW